MCPICDAWTLYWLVMGRSTDHIRPILKPMHGEESTPKGEVEDHAQYNGAANWGSNLRSARVGELAHAVGTYEEYIWNQTQLLGVPMIHIRTLVRCQDMVGSLSYK